MRESGNIFFVYTKGSLYLKFFTKTMDLSTKDLEKDIVQKCFFGRKSVFHDLFSRSITWGYWVTQEVTRAYMGLQGVTRELQRVTERYCRNVFL